MRISRTSSHGEQGISKVATERRSGMSLSAADRLPVLAAAAELSNAQSILAPHGGGTCSRAPGDG
jgi:hypothetical protein